MAHRICCRVDEGSPNEFLTPTHAPSEGPPFFSTRSSCLVQIGAGDCCVTVRTIEAEPEPLAVNIERAALVDSCRAPFYLAGHVEFAFEY